MTDLAEVLLGDAMAADESTTSSATSFGSSPSDPYSSASASRTTPSPPPSTPHSTPHSTTQTINKDGTTDDTLVKQRLLNTARSVLSRHGLKVNDVSDIPIYLFPTVASPPPHIKPADRFACPFILLHNTWDSNGMTFQDYCVKRVDPTVGNRKVRSLCP